MISPNSSSTSSAKSTSSSGSSASSSAAGVTTKKDSPVILNSTTELLEQYKKKATPDYISVKVTTPNFNVKITKVFDFNQNDTVWRAKQDVLVDFAQCKDLIDPLNFGFYMPPQGGRAGKFLDEERLLKEYPMDRSERHLEFRYKRRIFRHLQLTDEKKLQKINTKKYRKKFVELIYAKDIVEITNTLQKGLDPNYHEEKSGDTPLIIASLLDDCAELLKLLVQYGAYLDFRSEAGYTALHNVAMIGRMDTLQILLDLGASPNYKDAKGLTPLYYSITQSSNPLITELLLNDRAEIGITDIHGLQEIHQACKLGYIQHLEHLIYYGADVNSRTPSGSTPLHICALENRESCARILLFRGAHKNNLNFAQQTAADVAIVSNHFEIATLIHEFKESDVKLFLDKPTFSNRRGIKPVLREKQSASPKTSISEPSSPKSPTSPTSSNLQRASSESDMTTMLTLTRKPSTHSLPTMLEDVSESESDSDEEETLKLPRRPLVNAGVGTKRSPAPMKVKQSGPVQLRNRLYSSVPGRQFVAICDYEPQQPGELALEKGDIVEVLYVGEQGFWEGRVRGRAGWFPSSCVQETSKKAKNNKSKQRSWFTKKSTPLDAVDKVINSEGPKERVVHLKRSGKGFGFQLRGANSHLPHIEFSPTPQYPALQYIGDVDKGGVADKAGLKPGDFVLEINNENIITATHSYAVSIIANGGDELDLKVITVAPEAVNPELIIQNGTLRSKDVKGVKETLKEAGLKDEKTKKTPPPPPIRSSSTVLTQLSTEGGESVFSEASVDTTSETVVLDKSKGRQGSVKGMWAGTAYKLHGDEIKIREENISTGMGRKQKTASVDLAKEFEEKFKQITKAVAVNPAMYPPVQPKPIIDTNKKQKKSETNVQKQNTPPDYECTLESLRRGRANSIGKGDNVTRPNKTNVRSAGRPTSMIVTSNTEVLMGGQKFANNPLRKSSREQYNEQYGAQRKMSREQYIESQKSQLYANSNDLAHHRSLQNVNQYLEEQQFATVRRQNRQVPNQNKKYMQQNGRPQSALIDRDYRDFRHDDPHVPNLNSRLQHMDPTQTLPPRLNQKPQYQENAIKAHQQKLYNQEINYRYHDAPQLSPSNQHHQIHQQDYPTDGLLRLQNERNQRNQQRKSSAQQVPRNMPPAPSPPPPPPPPPDYLDAETSDHEIEQLGTTSVSSKFTNSIANAAAARSNRGKEDKKEDDVRHNQRHDSETTSLYNSSSSVSLDSTCSKDSGYDNSSEDTHSSALTQAIAQRAVKMTNKESSLSTTAEEPENMDLSDNASKLPTRPLSVEVGHSSYKEEDKGYSSPTSDRPRTKSANNPPPNVKPKPKRTFMKSDRNNNTPTLSEDYATTLLDGVIADAEASIDYDLISISSQNSIPEEEKVERKSSPPAVAVKKESTVKKSKETSPVSNSKVEEFSMDLPPPPVEFLDMFDPEVTSETKTIEPQPAKTDPPQPQPQPLAEAQQESSESHKKDISDPPPPYTPFKSDSISKGSSAKQSIPDALSGKPYMEWTVSDVGLWLEYLDLSQYKETFNENDIEGKHLAELSKDELKELGIKKLGHRMTLDDAISKLCRKT